MQHSDVTEADIGRAVRFNPLVTGPTTRYDYGIITGFNAKYILVRFFNQCLPESVHAHDLEYTELYEDDPEMDDRGDDVDPGDDRTEF